MMTSRPFVMSLSLKWGGQKDKRSNYGPGRPGCSSEGASRAESEDGGVRAEGREKKQETKANPGTCGQGREQKFYHQHFHTVLWEMKKKINEGEKKASKPLKLYFIIKKSFGKQRGYRNESRCGRAEVTVQHM